MKKKLNISNLKVTSFVTDLSKDSINTVKGGGTTDYYNCVSGGCGGGGNRTAVNCGSANPC